MEASQEMNRGTAPGGERGEGINDVVVEKTVPRRNRRMMCANRPLHTGKSFVVMYIFGYKSANVNILGRTDLIGRKTRHIFVQKDRE